VSWGCRYPPNHPTTDWFPLVLINWNACSYELETRAVLIHNLRALFRCSAFNQKKKVLSPLVPFTCYINKFQKLKCCTERCTCSNNEEGLTERPVVQNTSVPGKNIPSTSRVRDATTATLRPICTWTGLKNLTKARRKQERARRSQPEIKRSSMAALRPVARKLLGSPPAIFPKEQQWRMINHGARTSLRRFSASGGSADRCAFLITV
jgi:hypothetical protein